MSQGQIILSLILLLAIAVVFWFSQYRTIKEFYESGELRRVYRLRNGKKHGIERVYYRSGELNKEKHWANGRLRGKVITYYKSGEKYIIDNYSHGELVDTIILNTAISQI